MKFKNFTSYRSLILLVAALGSCYVGEQQWESELQEVERASGSAYSMAMLKLLKQILGTFLLTWGSFLFFVFTVDLSANIRIAGPMNMWPPPVWVYIILDSIFVLFAFIGMKLMGLKRIVCGAVMIIVSVLALFFIMTNHVNAPPRDGFSDGRYRPAEVEAYVLAYMIVALVLGVGLWFIIPHSWRRELS